MEPGVPSIHSRGVKSAATPFKILLNHSAIPTTDFTENTDKSTIVAFPMPFIRASSEIRGIFGLLLGRPRKAVVL
jgi:hypothetical protein